MKVDYPITVDNNHAIWRAFRNQAWPALYFTDAQGRVWRGLLVVYLNGSASEVFIYMATAKPDRIAQAE